MVQPYVISQHGPVASHCVSGSVNVPGLVLAPPLNSFMSIKKLLMDREFSSSFFFME
jgi:hypothetical protein